MAKNPKGVPPKPARPQFTLSRKASLAILLLIVLLAACLRFYRPNISPPGMSQDEAVNVWNAWCIMKTGTDQNGAPWPIFYFHAIGGNNTTLFLYYLMPFLAVGGFSLETARFAAAFAGVLTVAMSYYIGARLFNRYVGLAAALLLALNPWHIQQSRWAHEATLCPFLVALSLAAMLLANLPAGQPQGKPRPLLALLAGLLAGVSCYGYYPLRVFLPMFVVGIIVVTWRAWWEMLKTRRGLLAAAAWLVGIAATFGPLVWQHFADTAIGHRFETTRLWEKNAPAATVVSLVAGRYFEHFGPDWLFVNGDRFVIQSPPEAGMFHWYALPLMLLGVLGVVMTFRKSPAARIVAVWLLAYPVGDCMSRHFVVNGHMSLHALRSLPGIGGPILLAAFGLVFAGGWLLRKDRNLTIGCAAALAVAMAWINTTYLDRFFGKEFNDKPEVYHRFHADLAQACEWLRPGLAKTDEVFVTLAGMNQPFLITLVGLQYDPQQWFADNKVVDTADEWDLYLCYGKMNFMYPQGRDYWMRRIGELKANGRLDRVVFIVRPEEAAWLNQELRLELTQPVKTIRGPAGTWPLMIFEKAL